ncbi:MAG: hypothetical protein A2V69_00435 [Candidatus Portnoybacteria bacterium RBG_13_40_8]|uniref:Uncharacterized protein n=1 Tax=Candidatus Portnoybacteria bacterium RBG_13_40_8 TaxID=1801990 RepID=A0A1G2F2T5_9BACT|nr:MAG: hypothetical protein A2V69_00435 [Candidatus Portnoybacteria bacterium RBG_13_40_8]OGZ36030.1 MAG: hypothetical protein A2V60_01795 [Candidatus Portnoybacteria bacterium RIFCSPHIGHO2_01_FULL_39_19]
MKESIEKALSKKEAKEKLEKILKEVGGLIEKEEELKEKKETYDPRLVVVNPKDLTRDDLEIFGKFQDDSWLLAEFTEYTDKVSRELREKDNNSRDNFRDWIAEKAQIKFGREESAEEREKDN